MALFSGAEWGDFERKYLVSMPVQKNYSRTYSEPRKRKLHGEQNNTYMYTLPKEKTFLVHELKRLK